MEYKSIILSKLLEYLKIKRIKFSKGTIKTLPCPQCGKTANIIPNAYTVNCFVCNPQKNIGHYWNLIDIVRMVEADKKDLKEDDIFQYLKELLQVKVLTKKDELDIEYMLSLYKNWGFDLVPIVTNGKIPAEKEWTTKNHKDIVEWRNWINEGLNLGIKTGKISGITILDIDQKPIPETIKNIMGEPIIQESSKGFHLIYKYVPELRKTRIDELKIDVENDGGQVVIYPSTINDIQRKFITTPQEIPVMGKELKTLLLSKTGVPLKTQSEVIKEEIDTENFKIDPTKFNLKNNQLDGCCNTEFIKLGGILRKQLNMKQTSYVLNILNRHMLESPMDTNAINSMMREINKYISFDEVDLAHKILEYLKDVEDAGRMEIAMAIAGTNRGEEKKRVDKALQYLIKEKYISKKGKSYICISDVEWQENLINIGTPITFKMPYFYDVMTFHEGDMIILGAPTSAGKCITSGYLLTNQGMIDIEEIGKKKQDGISKVDKHIRLYRGRPKYKTYGAINYFYKEKVNKTIKIISSLGYELEGTPEHPILVQTPNKKIIFKQLDQIIKEDKLVLSSPKLFATKSGEYKNKPLKYIPSKHATNLNNVEIPNIITPELAKFFGYIIGDGNINGGTINIYQNKKDKNVINEIKKICNLYKFPYSIDTEPNMVRFRILSTKLIYYIKRKLFNIQNDQQVNLTSPNRYIPNIILRNSKEIQQNFISALFDCESSISHRSYNLEITMASKKLIHALHVMLLNFGIISSLTEKKIKTYPDNTYYRLFISQEFTQKFLHIFKPVKYNNLIIDNIRKFRQIKIVDKNKTSEGYFIDDVKSITINTKEQYVYDVNMDSKKYKYSNQFWTNGFISHNTHQAVNIIKQLSDQGVKPCYISLEGGSRWASISLQLGLKEGDFFWFETSNPERIKLHPDSITIIDWLCPHNYAETDKILQDLNDKVREAKGVLIVFVQLRDNGDWFAKDLIKQFPALACRYIYDKTGNGEWGKFYIDKTRDAKIKMKNWGIPCHFDWDTKLFKRVDEIDENIKETGE